MFSYIILFNAGKLALSAIYLSAGSILVTMVFYFLFPLFLVFTLGKLLLIFVAKISSVAAGLGVSVAQDNEELDDVFGIAGYDYDPKQDIFYSTVNPWQRKFGYCRLYDEALAPLDMIIDCEPITFSYGGRNWMIEFWKGQYALNTGCEIGFYKEVFNLGIPGLLGSPFYRSVDNKDMMYMAFSLKKKGNELFYREDKHWWLTGFKLGEFSNPSELTMDIGISFKEKDMCYAFIDGLLRAGYPEEEIVKVGNRVYFTFGKPYTEQPITRTRLTDWIVQRKNKIMCAEYRRVTSAYDNIQDKLNVIKKYRPGIYKKAIDVGKSRKVYKKYDRIANYIE